METTACQQLDFSVNKGIAEFDLPGFRFHPTEQELVGFYLKNITQGKRMNFNVIRRLDLYRYDPWELPRLSIAGQRELFFFVPRDKNGSGRTNRIAVSGYWKATGSDRPILDGRLGCIGIRKTLVFYEGRAPRGQKTDWIMNEYRMPDHCKPKVEVVVCRIYRKANPLKRLERAPLNHLEDQPSVDDDDLHCCTKPHETRFFPPVAVDKKLNNRGSARSEVCTIFPSQSAECRETKHISVSTDLQTAPDLCQHTPEAPSSSLEENYIAHTEVWSPTPANNSNIYGEFIDPALQAFVEDDTGEGFSVCENHRNLSFMDLSDCSSDSSCLDPPFPTSLMDGRSDIENQFLVAPHLSMDYFCDEAALHPPNLEEKHPGRDLWDTPDGFASSDFEYSFFFD